MLEIINALTIVFMITGICSALWAAYYLVFWDYRLHRYGVLGSLISGGSILFMAFLLKAIYIWPVLG